MTRAAHAHLHAHTISLPCHLFSFVFLLQPTSRRDAQFIKKTKCPAYRSSDYNDFLFQTWRKPTSIHSARHLPSLLTILRGRSPHPNLRLHARLALPCLSQWAPPITYPIIKMSPTYPHKPPLSMCVCICFPSCCGCLSHASSPTCHI